MHGSASTKKWTLTAIPKELPERPEDRSRGLASLRMASA